MKSPEGMPPSPFSSPERKKTGAIEELEHEMDGRYRGLVAALRGIGALAKERARFWDSYLGARRAFGEVIEETAKCEIETGAGIPIPDGTYELEVSFDRLGGGRRSLKPRLREPSVGGHLGVMIKRAWGAIGEIGLHNFSPLVPEDGPRLIAGAYHISGPDGFSYRSSCFVGLDGSIVRRAEDVR